jgi:hypothetical protein
MLSGLAPADRSRAAVLVLVAILVHPCCVLAEGSLAASTWTHITGMQELGLEQASQQASHLRQLLQNADVPALNPYGGLKMEGECASVSCVSAVIIAVANAPVSLARHLVHASSSVSPSSFPSAEYVFSTTLRLPVPRERSHH